MRLEEKTKIVVDITVSTCVFEILRQALLVYVAAAGQEPRRLGGP